MAENIPLWEATGTNPPEELWKNGYAELAVPAPAHFNYLMNQMTTRLRYLATNLVDRTGDLATYSVAQHGSEYQSFWSSSVNTLTAVEDTDGRFILKTTSTATTGINAKLNLYVNTKNPYTGVATSPATVSVPIVLECTDANAIKDISVISFSGFSPTSYTLKRLDEGSGNIAKLLLTMTVTTSNNATLQGECTLRFANLSANTTVYASRPYVVFGDNFTGNAYSREPLNALYKQAFKANSVPVTDLNVTVANVSGNQNALLGSQPYNASVITDSAKRAGLPSTGDGVIFNFNNTLGTDSTAFRGLARLAIVNDGVQTAPRLFASYLSSNFSSTSNAFVEFVNSSRLAEELGGYVQSSNIDYLLASYAKTSALSSYVLVSSTANWQKAKVTKDDGTSRYVATTATELNNALVANPVNGIASVTISAGCMNLTFIPEFGASPITPSESFKFSGIIMGDATSSHYSFELFAYGLVASTGKYHPLRVEGYLPRPTATGSTTKITASQCYDSSYMANYMSSVVSTSYTQVVEDIRKRVSGVEIFNGSVSSVNSYLTFSRNMINYDHLEIEYQLATGNYPRTQMLSLELVRGSGNTVLAISDTHMPTSTSSRSYELSLSDSTGKWSGNQLQITLNNTWDLSTKTGTTNSNGIIIKSVRGIVRK